MMKIRSGHLEVVINPSLGGEVSQITFLGHQLLDCHEWEPPVATSRIRSYGDSRLDWLSEYRGGWQLLVPNAGAACVVDEVPLPFHGEWSRTIVEVVAATPTAVTMRAGTRLAITVERTIEVFDRPDRLRLSTTLENVGVHAQPFLWGEHPAFAAEPGDVLDLPSGPVVASELPSQRTAWPSGGADRLDLVPSSRPLESVHYLPDRPAGWAALRGVETGVGLAWDVRDFPHVWLWREFGSRGFPFYGRASIVAIEPANSWPGDGLAAAIETGQANWLAPGERRRTAVTLVPFVPDGRPVSGVSHNGIITFGDHRDQQLRDDQHR